MTMDYFPSLQKLAETSSVVTLDVFDTCIHRAVARPVHVFDLVVRKWCAKQPDHLHLLTRFRTERIRAEAAARRACKEREDITFAAIYEELGQVLSLSEADLKALADLELQTELDLCYPNPIIKAFYDGCVAAGKKIAFISDMYLPSSHIAQMLSKCGFDPHHLFVSSEVGLCKGTGRLFDHAAERLEVADRALILHIGDNEQADIRAAHKSGLKAFHFDYLQKLDADIANRSGLPSRDETTFTGAVAFGLLRRRVIEQASRSTERQLVDIGYEAFGPAMAGWLMWLQRRIAEIAPKKVLLFARDARLVNSLVAEGALSFGAAEVAYIYVSRYALSFAAIRVLDDRLLESLMRRFEGQTIGRFLGAWCEFSPERLKDMGFPNDPDAMISRSIYPELKRFIYENQAHFLSAAREHRDRAGLYLARMVKNESTALIDVGWNGNMQSDWHNAVTTCISRDQVNGLYFALLPSAQAMIKRGHKMEGWYWQPHRVEDEFVMLSSGGVELLELALSADHGTTLGYDADGSPILADAGEDPAYQDACSNLQAGITAFWKDLRALCPERELALQPGRPEEWTAPLSRLVMNPSSQESELLGDIRHSVEGGQVKAVPLAPKLVGGQAKPERVLWRPGFAARNGLFSAL